MLPFAELLDDGARVRFTNTSAAAVALRVGDTLHQLTPQDEASGCTVEVTPPADALELHCVLESLEPQFSFDIVLREPSPTADAAAPPNAQAPSNTGALPAAQAPPAVN